MSPRLFVALGFFVVSVFATATAQEERLNRRELTAETQRLSTELTEIDSRATLLQRQNADLALKVRELESQNAQLTGRIETLQFQLGQSRDEANRMREDDQAIGEQLEDLNQQIAVLRGIVYEQNRLILDGQLVEGAGEQAAVIATNRLGQGGTVEGRVVQTAPSGAAASSAPASGSLGTISASSLPGEAGPLFADAKARLLRFDYAGAERSFRAFLDRFGDDAQAGEAQYWLGEVLYQQQNYNESGAAYRDMIQNFPDDARAPDALVKLGRSLRLIGDSERACSILATLDSRYPNASPVTRNLANVERSRSGCDS